MNTYLYPIGSFPDSSERRWLKKWGYKITPSQPETFSPVPRHYGQLLHLRQFFKIPDHLSYNDYYNGTTYFEPAVSYPFTKQQEDYLTTMTPIPITSDIPRNFGAISLVRNYLALFGYEDPDEENQYIINRDEIPSELKTDFYVALNVVQSLQAYYVTYLDDLMVIKENNNRFAKYMNFTRLPKIQYLVKLTPEIFFTFLQILSSATETTNGMRLTKDVPTELEKFFTTYSNEGLIRLNSELCALRFINMDVIREGAAQEPTLENQVEFMRKITWQNI